MTQLRRWASRLLQRSARCMRIDVQREALLGGERGVHAIKSDPGLTQADRDGLEIYSAVCDLQAEASEPA